MHTWREQDSSNLAIVDISDPTTPVLVGNWDPNDTNVMNLHAPSLYHGSYAYVAGAGSDNLAIVDISDPTTPVLPSATGTPTTPM